MFKNCLSFPELRGRDTQVSITQKDNEDMTNSLNTMRNQLMGQTLFFEFSNINKTFKMFNVHTCETPFSHAVLIKEDPQAM